MGGVEVYHNTIETIGVEVGCEDRGFGSRMVEDYGAGAINVGGCTDGG